MAKVIDRYETPEGYRINVYDSGIHYNTSKGRIHANPNGGKYAITSDNSREMLKLREIKRMQLYSEGALLAVGREDLIAEYGEDAHVIERAMNMQTIASSADAGKAAVMAAAHLDKAQGYDVKQTAGEGEQVAGVEQVLGAMLLEYIRARMDADATDTSDI